MLKPIHGRPHAIYMLRTESILARLQASLYLFKTASFAQAHFEEEELEPFLQLRKSKNPNFLQQ